jgi:hypothetical protein
MDVNVQYLIFQKCIYPVCVHSAGCPFKHSDQDNLRQKLAAQGLRKEDVDQARFFKVKVVCNCQTVFFVSMVLCLEFIL